MHPTLQVRRLWFNSCKTIGVYLRVRGLGTSCIKLTLICVLLYIFDLVLCFAISMASTSRSISFRVCFPESINQIGGIVFLILFFQNSFYFCLVSSGASLLIYKVLLLKSSIQVEVDKEF